MRAGVQENMYWDFILLNWGMGHSRSLKEKQAYTYRNSEQIPLLFVLPSPLKLRLPLDRMTANLNSISISDKQEFVRVDIGAEAPFFVMPSPHKLGLPLDRMTARFKIW
jgi:hypothetical protein